MHFSNMAENHSSIQSYSLFGESQHLPDVLHCETIAARSVLHDWELAPHRHTRLHQVLLIESGGGVAHLDGEQHALAAGALINVPPGHVHAFRFTQHTQGWVATLADELMDEIFVRVGDVRRDLARPAVVTASPPISQAMGQIWQEFSGRAKARALVLRGLSATLLGWVARAIEDHSPDDTAAPESSLVQRLEALIEAHFLEHWQVADYARAGRVAHTPQPRGAGHHGRIGPAADRGAPDARGAAQPGLHAPGRGHHCLHAGLCRPGVLHPRLHARCRLVAPQLSRAGCGIEPGPQHVSPVTRC